MPTTSQQSGSNVYIQHCHNKSSQFIGTTRRNITYKEKLIIIRRVNQLLGMTMEVYLVKTKSMMLPTFKTMLSIYLQYSILFVLEAQ